MHGAGLVPSHAALVPFFRVTEQFVNPCCGADNARMRRAEGALDRAGRAAVVAALYHTGTVTLARLAAHSLATHAEAWASVRTACVV